MTVYKPEHLLFKYHEHKWNLKNEWMEDSKLDSFSTENLSLLTPYTLQLIAPSTTTHHSRVCVHAVSGWKWSRECAIRLRNFWQVTFNNIACFLFFVLTYSSSCSLLLYYSISFLNGSGRAVALSDVLQRTCVERQRTTTQRHTTWSCCSGRQAQSVSNSAGVLQPDLPTSSMQQTT